MGAKQNTGLILLLFIGLFLSINLASADSNSYKMCYQETANQATSCGGLSGGSYSGQYLEGHGYTSCNGLTGAKYSVVVTYLKPNGIKYGTVWQVKHGDFGIYNVTVPQSCLNYYSDRVVFKFNTALSNWSTGYAFSWGECIDGTETNPVMGNNITLTAINVSDSGEDDDCTADSTPNEAYDGNWNTFTRIRKIQPCNNVCNYFNSGSSWVTGHIFEEAIIWNMSVSSNLNSPLDGSYNNYNVTFNCSASAQNGANALTNMTIYIWNSTGAIVNTSIKEVSGMTNQSIYQYNFTVDDSYKWNCLVYDNSSNGEWANNNNTFHVVVSPPNVTLYTPANNSYIPYKENIFFSFIGRDVFSLDTCSLWGDWTGLWHNNYSWYRPTNNVLNWTGVNLPSDGMFKYNVLCNGTTGKSSFAESNRTFTIDTIYPQVNITRLTSSDGSQVVTFNSTQNDTNLDSCKYTVLDSGNFVDGFLNNLSFSCNNASTFTVSTYGTYTLIVYANDSAGNENISSVVFTVSTSAPIFVVTGGGGGGAITLTKIKVVALIKPEEDQNSYEPYKRALIFAKIRNYTFTYGEELSDVRLAELADEMSAQNKVTVSANLMKLWYAQYVNKQYEVTEVTEDQFNRYSLVRSEVVFGNTFTVTPALVNSYTFVSLCGNEDVGKSWSTIVRASKVVSNCTVKEGDFTCNVTSPSTIEIKYTFKDYDITFKNVEGEIEYIAGDSKDTARTKIQYLNIVNTCGEVNVVGFRTTVLNLFIGGLITIALIIVGIYILRKRRKNQKINFKKLFKK